MILDDETWQRVLLICPHPDDETLGAGILLQEAVSRRAAIRVVYLTDGDRNPIAQLLHEGQWPLTSSDRGRFAAVRRGEAIRALELLGVTSTDVQFWSLPDQRLARFCERHSAPVERLAGLIREFQPTLVVGPTPRDLHLDHLAAANIARQAMIGAASNAILLTYHVHGDPEADDTSVILPCSVARLETKLAAMNCHETQLLASRTRMLQLAQRDEMFREWADEAAMPAVRFRTAQRLWHLLPAFRPVAPMAEEPEVLVRS